MTTSNHVTLSKLPLGIKAGLVSLLVAGLTTVAPISAEAQGVFIRGDANMDGQVGFGDIYTVLNIINGGGFLCEDAADTNDDGNHDLGDIVYFLAYMFQSGPALPAPFPNAGPDETPDNLTCVTSLSATLPPRIVAVNEPDVLTGFTFERVVQAIIDTDSTTGTSNLIALAPQDFYALWWVQVGPPSGIGMHCSSMINGFDNACGRAESQLADNDPFTDPTSDDAYIPLALFNRFDLAPADGANCGEYRIIFGKRSGLTDLFDRNFINFESVLPNPNPGAGLDGCLPILQVWDSLDGLANDAARAQALESLFFEGIQSAGVSPVVHADHYRVGAGQIRTNTRMSEQEPWALREWKLLEQCSGIYCWSHPVQSPTDRNPDATLFTSATTPLAQAFQQDFTDNVAALVVDPRGYTVPEQYEAAISIIDSGNDYRSSFSNNRSFRNLIQQELDSIQSSLTPDDIVARATSQSCAGCHNLTVGDNLGGGLVGEPSLGFTHVGENGSLSLGLLEQLLPEREDIVRAFMP